MEFKETELPGVFDVETTPHGDERGLFARLYCPDEFVAAGIAFSPTTTRKQARAIRPHLLPDPPPDNGKVAYAVPISGITIDGSLDEDALIAKLAAQFPDVDVADDVRAFLTEARSRGWIR